MKNVELFKKWLDLASQDLRMAEFALSQSLWLQTAFHVQQSIEKSLKGLIVLAEIVDPPYTHDLTRLAKLAGDSFPEVLKYNRVLASINPYYVRARYPSYREQVASALSKDTLERFLATAREILHWSEQKKT